MNESSTPKAIVAQGLSVRLPNGRTLLQSSLLDIVAGEFVLLVGPSGSGKSTLLRLLADITDPAEEQLEVEGEILINGRGDPAARRDIGLVFQNLALFDELTAVQNVQFAIDHRHGGTTDAAESATALLGRLRVPIGSPLRNLSGGERQRVAVARTLASGTPILFFDEPTTGLDPPRARHVAALIAETHREHGRTVVVVTHDFTPFLAFNPRLVLVDPVAKTLRQVDEAALRRYFDTGEEIARPQTAIGRKGAAAARGWGAWLEQPGEALIVLARAAVDPFRGWSQPWWKARYLWHYFRMVALGTTTIYVILAGLMLGFVSVMFAFRRLPYSHITVPLFTDEFLAATGYSSFRVLIPLLISVLLAGKCGASVAADVGARRLTNQFEAMRSFRVSPRSYLYGNIVVALVVGAPLLTLLAFFSSTYASMVAYLLAADQATVTVFRRNFFATIWPINHVLPKGTFWMLGKCAGSGLLVAALSYLIGAGPKHSSIDVSRGVGRTIFWGSLAVLLLHSIFSFIEF